MKKIANLILFTLCFFILLACSNLSRPEQTKVASDAPLKPINTPERSLQLIEQYSK